MATNYQKAIAEAIPFELTANEVILKTGCLNSNQIHSRAYRRLLELYFPGEARILKASYTKSGQVSLYNSMQWALKQCDERGVLDWGKNRYYRTNAYGVSKAFSLIARAVQSKAICKEDISSLCVAVAEFKSKILAGQSLADCKSEVTFVDLGVGNLKEFLGPNSTQEIVRRILSQYLRATYHLN